MLDDDSRYHDLPELIYDDAEGRRVVYKARRLLPREEPAATPFREQVAPGDRPDLVAYRALGDPLRFWRLCEANLEMRPFELTRRSGRRLLVPPPGE